MAISVALGIAINSASASIASGVASLGAQAALASGEIAGTIKQATGQGLVGLGNFLGDFTLTADLGASVGGFGSDLLP